VKCLKERKGSFSMVVGKDLSKVKVTNFATKTLVGCFCGNDVKVDALHLLIELNWKHLLGYSLEAHSLVRGWSCFFFKVEEDYIAILRSNWSWAPFGLVLKMWTTDFDPACKLVVVRKIWAILPSLPLAL
jgi:hypothetical protein